MAKLESQIAIVICMWAVAHMASNSWQGSPSAYGLLPQSHQNQAPPDEQETAQEVLAPLTDEERALSLRELIANQPDFGADLEFFVAEHKIGGAYGFTYRLVRKGKRFREESKFWIFVGEIGKRTARLFPPSKSYDDMEPPRGESMNEGGLLSNPSILLADAGLTLATLGKQKIEGHDCIKIEATQKDRPEKIYLYAARDLKNLIILTQTMGLEKSTTARLRNITFDVPDALVQIPSDYKVIERDRLVKVESAKVTYGGRLYDDAVVFRAPGGELFIRVKEYETYLVRPDLKTVGIAFQGLLVTPSGEYVWQTREREAFSKTNYRVPLSFAKTLRRLNLMHVTSYRTSLYVIDFKCAPNSGEAQAIESVAGRIAATEFMNEPTYAAMGGAPKGYDAADMAVMLRCSVHSFEKLRPTHYFLVLAPLARDRLRCRWAMEC